MAVEGVITEIAIAGSDLNIRLQITAVMADFLQYLTTHTFCLCASLRSSTHSCANHAVSSNNVTHIEIATKYYICKGKNIKLSLKKAKVKLSLCLTV
jgi:hypothetical protein